MVGLAKSQVLVVLESLEELECCQLGQWPVKQPQ